MERRLLLNLKQQKTLNNFFANIVKKLETPKFNAKDSGYRKR